MSAARAWLVDARPALAIAAAAFGLRLAWGLAAGVVPGAAFDDAFWYHHTAAMLARGRGYLNPITAAPTAGWPPGYPLLLSLAYRVTGPTPAAAVWLNACFGALTCLFTWRLGVRLVDRRVGLVAAALLAVYPAHVFFAALVLSETLFACLVTGLLLAAVALLEGPRRSRALWWLAWGLGVGVTALVRAESVVLVVVPVASLLRAGERRTAARAFAAIVVGSVVVLAPWTVRNARVFGAFVPTSTGFGRTVWIGHNPSATGGMTLAIQTAMQDAMRDAGVSPATTAGELAMDHALRARALAFALANPGRELALTPLRTYHLFRGDHVWQAWYGPGTPRIAPSPSAREALGVLSNAAYVLLGVLAILGWWLRPRAGRPAWRPLATFIVVWIALFTVIYGDPRFHHVLIPFACVPAAITLVAAAARVPRRRRARPPAALRDRGPVAALFACSGAVAVVVALANVASLAAVRDVARIRDLRPLAELRVALDATDVQFLSALPLLVNAPFDLHAATTLAGFAALAVVTYLACAWTLAALAAPLAVSLARRAAGPSRTPRGFALAVFAAGLVPIAAHRLALWTSAGGVAITAASVALAAAFWLAARPLVSEASARRLVAVCGGVALAGAALGLVGTLLAVLATAPRDARPAARAGAPNVLLVSIDTLRPDHLGSYGYRRDTSPTIDGLAAAGARFATAISPSSWTLPTHMSLLTALPPEVHGVSTGELRLGPGVTTLADVMRARGYTTAGFVSGPYLDAGYGFARGFDHYDDYSAVRISKPATHRARTSPALVGAVVDWLDAATRTGTERPFFLFVHMWDVHYDFNPPPPFDRMFDPDYAGTMTGLDFETGDAVHLGMDARDLAHVVALYDGEIRYTDGYLARILDALRARHLLDTTVVIVTGDHGEEFFEHGNKGHHKALYDESIRVPLILRYPPRIPAGVVVDRQVRLVDVAPTILALTGAPTSPGFGLDPALVPYAGRDLTPLATGDGASLAPVPAFAELQPHAMSAVRHEDAKLIVAPFGAPKEQLFDLRADPGERIDRSAANPARANALRGELATWHDTARMSAKQAETARMSREHQDALRALGYIQ